MSKRKRRRQQPPAVKSDPQTVEMLTVGWMLSVVTTLLCEVGFLLSLAYVLFVDRDASRVTILGGMLLFAGAVVGLTSLALCAAVVKLRRVSPPSSVIVSAVVIGALPLITVLLESLRKA